MLEMANVLSALNLFQPRHFECTSMLATSIKSCVPTVQTVQNLEMFHLHTEERTASL